MTDIADLLGERGPLARHVSGFAPRSEQQVMARAVADTIADGAHLVVEAGTGTGKTFAYLMPVLQSGCRAIISTGTRHLQDQLFNKDLPVVRKALAAPVSAALLKGRSNYLCLHRLATAAGSGRLRGRQLHDLETVRAWAERTRHGDMAELGSVPEDSPVWPQVTSTADNCLGQECEHFQDCHVVKARRNALDADVIVINHHLLFADMVLREEGFGELLPGVDAFIIDEAHQLPEVAATFFGITLSSHQLRDLVRDLRLEFQRESGDLQDLTDTADRVEGLLPRLRLALGQSDRRAAWSEVAGSAELAASLETLAATLQELTEWLAGIAERGKGIESCLQRAGILSARLQHLMQPDSGEYIHWFESYRNSFRLNLTPLNVAEVFRDCLERLPSAWVFTSATLAVGDSFSHFTGQLGISDAGTLKLDSPFNYADNTLLLLPQHMPAPNERHYTGEVIGVAREVIVASGGRAFILFTSHSALRAAAAAFEQDLDYPLLVQGSAPRAELLDRFRAHGNAVLLGTSSFWEGVDVRGEALSCVIIDKLPFGSPGEPVLQARIEALREQGMNPFMDFQLPQAVIALKQGVGRLIRDHEDRGVLVLCDPRLLGKPYGRIFLNSLPDMPRTRSMDDVRSFFDVDLAPAGLQVDRELS